MDFKGKVVLVTGGTGFIGTHLCNRLTELGANVTVLVHKSPYKGKGFATQILGDLRDVNSGWNNLIELLQPEVVFHLAAQPLVSVASMDEYKTLETNVRGTYNLLNVCKNIKSIKSLVHISTDKVYGNVSPILDITPIGGVHHPYNASKLASDNLAQMYSNFFGIPMVIVRNANVYGAGDIHFDRIVPNAIQKIFRGERPVIRGDGNNTRDYIHVSEVVDGYIRAASLPYKNTLTVLNLCGINYSTLQIVDAVLAKMNRIDLYPFYENLWTGEIPHQHIINDKAFALINWLPMIDIDYGLDLTVPWYVEYLKNAK
jgi:CDP-glucose 4,6-dehydratase